MDIWPAASLRNEYGKLFDSKPASNSVPGPRGKQGISFHSRSPMAKVMPNAMPNKLSQGDLLPALDPGMLTPRQPCACQHQEHPCTPNNPPPRTYSSTLSTYSTPQTPHRPGEDPSPPE